MILLMKTSCIQMSSEFVFIFLHVLQCRQAMVSGLHILFK